MPVGLRRVLLVPHSGKDRSREVDPAGVVAGDGLLWGEVRPVQVRTMCESGEW